MKKKNKKIRGLNERIEALENKVLTYQDIILYTIPLKDTMGKFEDRLIKLEYESHKKKESVLKRFLRWLSGLGDVKFQSMTFERENLRRDEHE